MLTHHQIKLEYNKILDILATYCSTYIGKELALKLHPFPKQSKVQSMLKETTQAADYINKRGNLPITEIADITVWLKSLESSNTLSAKALLETVQILRLSREVKDYFSEDKTIETSKYTVLENYVNSLYSNPGIEERIRKSILDENTISDDASVKLAGIRRSKSQKEQEIREKLNNFIRSSQYSKYIMEQVVTIKNDRFVIPVKSEYKEQVKGFVHDVSASGSTFFIEPISVFELNNNLNNIKLEEGIEIEHILNELSSLLSPYINELKNNVNLIGRLDFIFAKAKYSRAINAIEPQLNNEKYFNLIKARHPLINPKECVPIDIALGKDYTSLIITGPNTGGKTVTLKTVGLLMLMAASGLHIPADEKSSVFIFDQVFASIGDEQSIQESLSTFSSHMLTIIDILEHATSKSLIILDELGSGTDPVEGACLAISLLEHFKNINALTVCTTHYQEIKNYALATEEFENASSEFDIENLKPTYKLLIGIPGKSNAFAISKRLGLNDDILSRAQELMTEENVNLEELMKNVHDDKVAVEKEKAEIEKNSKEIAELKKQLQEEKDKLKQEKAEIINNAKTKAKTLLLKTKEEANNIIKELNELKANSENTSLTTANKLRTGLNDSLKDVSVSVINKSNSSNDKKIKPENIKVGMDVFVIPVNQNGIVLSMPNSSNEVQVQIGSLKMNVKINKLEKAEKKANVSNSSESKKSKLSSISPNYSSIVRNANLKSMSATTELNVIGENVEDACFLIDKFLDNCALSKIEYARIVHGKGTGKLREGIHKFLRTHPHVKSFRLGTFGEGEMGVTIVEIK